MVPLRARCLAHAGQVRRTLISPSLRTRTFFERYRLQFRAEFFNLFNRVEFGLPDTNFGDSTFGVISNQANIARQIQFGLKFYW